MFWRKKPEEELRKKEEEIEKLKARIKELEQTEQELRKQLSFKRRVVDKLLSQVRQGKVVWVHIAAGNSIRKVKAKLSGEGLKFKFAGKTYTILPDPQHFFYIKRGLFGKYEPAVFVDLEANVTIPPPSSGLNAQRNIAARTAGALLDMYRSIVLGTRQQTVALALGFFLAIAGMAIGLVIAWISMNNVNAALGQVSEALRQVSQVLQQVPAPPPTNMTITPTP